MAKAVACEKCAEKDKEIILLQEENDRLMSSIDDANADADAAFARAERAEEELAKFSRGWEPAALNVSCRAAEPLLRFYYGPTGKTHWGVWDRKGTESPIRVSSTINGAMEECAFWNRNFTP